MNLLNNRTKLWWVLLIFAIPSFVALLRTGFFPMHDDLPVVRMYALQKCVVDGQIPCRWTSELGFGYGYPLMNFYPPLPYIFGLIPRLIGLSYIDTTKTLFILGLVLAAGFAARLGNLFFGKWGAMVFAIMYLYGPYHGLDLYVRGDLNELWAMAFFPAVLWAGYKAARNPKVNNLISLSVFFTFIILTHLGMTLIMAPVIVLWIFMWFFYFGKGKYTANSIKLFLSGLAAIALAAFFIIPVLFEQQMVHVETMTMGYFNFLAHFVDIKQLFVSRFWGFGPSRLGPNDGLSFQIGTLHWLLGAIASVGVIVWFRSNKKLLNAYLFFSLVFIVAAFLTHSRATPIWLKIPKLEFLQFPWRLLAVILPAASFMSACVITLVKNKYKATISILLCLLVIGLYGSYFLPENWIYNRTDSLQFSGAIWQREVTAGIFDYLPKWSRTPPGAPAPADVTTFGSTQAITMSKKSNFQEYLVNNPTASNTKLQINTLYYSGWVARVNGKTVPIDTTQTGKDGIGLINLLVPPGTNNVQIAFTETPLRLASDLISLATWILVGIYVSRPQLYSRLISSLAKYKS